MSTAGADRVRLVVFVQPEEEELIKRGDKFCSKPEPGASLLREFCAGTRELTYPENYVSAAVIRGDEDICSSGAAIYAGSLNSVALRYAVLKESILVNVCTVGNDDLLQLMKKIATAWRNNGNWRFLMRDVRNLGSESFESKRELLLWATRNRGPHEYSEARLNRCIDRCDIEIWGGC